MDGKRISFVNKDTGWVGGTAGGLPFLWRTTNAGITWTVQSDNTGFGKVFFLKNKVNGEYVGWSQNYGTLWKTTNSGNNWIQNSTIGTLPDAIAMFFSDQFTGYISNNTRLTKTTNGGTSWNNYEMPSGNLISARWLGAFDVLNKDTIYGEGGDRYFGGGKVRRIIWVSTNGGVNWGFQQPDTSIAKFFIGIDFVNKDTGWSSWIHTINGGGPVIYPTYIDSSSTLIPSEYVLKQNYPNPFNPSTTIEFSLPKESNVKLKILDLSGRTVFWVVYDMLMRSGLHNFKIVEFEKLNLASGVYFYQMEARDINTGQTNFKQSRKMILLK